MDYTKVAERGVKVRLVKNICKVRIPSRNSQSQVIELVDLIHGRDEIEDWSVLEKNFKTLDGKSVKMNRMKRGAVYTLVEIVEADGTAIKVPKGKNVKIGGRQYGDNYVIVAINNSIGAVPLKYFKKMFILTETLGDCKKRTAGFSASRRSIKEDRTETFRSDKTLQESIAEQMAGLAGGNKADQHEEAENVSKTDKKTKVVKLVAQIVDISDNVIGYAAVDNNGKKYKLSYDKVVKMASAGLVENARVKKVGNKLQLRGYAMKLENLSKVYK